MPRAAIRRPLTIPLTLILTGALLAAGPLLLALAALARGLGHPKPLIAVRMLLAYCAREIAVLVACGGLWALAAGGRQLHRPRPQGLHWRLLCWFVHGIATRTLSLLDIAIDEECPPEASAAIASPAPLLILSRHAGPGDTFLLIDRLLTHHRRRPSVVLREAIVLDPAIDLLTSRLPHAVIDKADGDGAEEVIEELAATLAPGAALLLYPEGGNFTEERRRSALASLRRRGRHRAARAGERMEHVLPPRPCGVQAARRGNPDAAVLFVAHTGLGLAAFPLDIYRDMPIGRTLKLRMWLVPPAEVPADEEAEVRWLNEWWQRIDAWVRASGGEDEIESRRA